FFEQSNSSLIDGMGDIPEDTRGGQDSIQMDEAFHTFTPLVVLVPKGDIAREDKLASELETLPNIKSIVSYTDAVGSGIPPEFLAESEREEFFSENYSRLVLNATTDSEGDEAF